MDFAAITQAYIDMVYRVAVSYLGSPADGEDVTQTVFLKLLGKLDTLESPEHVKHWLLRVTVNECKRLAASPWRRHTVPLETVSASLSFESPEQSELFLAVMQLPPKDRLAVDLYYYEGYSAAQAARIMGCSATAFTTRLARARTKLREALGGPEYV